MDSHRRCADATPWTFAILLGRDPDPPARPTQ